MSIVYLIGAGPGDPGPDHRARPAVPRGGGRRAVRPLVHPRLLRHARPDAEKIDVGVAAPQPLEQEAICYLLAEKAREGKIVARLKWGDPFVFDRGGAEALFLHEQGVRFEVVPGVPAGIARAELRRHPDHLSRRRRHADVRPRPRGRGQDAGRRSTGRASRGSTARSSATPARSSCRTSLQRAARRTAARRTSRRRSSTTARCRRRRRIVGTLERARRDASKRLERPAPGDPGRRPRRRRCASTCAGSTRGRCSASASWSRGRASRRPSSSSCSRRWAPRRSKRR